MQTIKNMFVRVIRYVSGFYRQSLTEQLAEIIAQEKTKGEKK